MWDVPTAQRRPRERGTYPKIDKAPVTNPQSSLSATAGLTSGREQTTPVAQPHPTHVLLLCIGYRVSSDPGTL
jgi:hypothetical protein